jgi:hypothetical protein
VFSALGSAASRPKSNGAEHKAYQIVAGARLEPHNPLLSRMNRLQPHQSQERLSRSIPRSALSPSPDQGVRKKQFFVTAITLGLEGEITSIG